MDRKIRAAEAEPIGRDGELKVTKLVARRFGWLEDKPVGLIVRARQQSAQSVDQKY